MLDLDEIVEELSLMNLSRVSHGTDIHYQQLWRIKSGKDVNPTYKIVKKLSDYFKEMK